MTQHHQLHRWLMRRLLAIALHVVTRPLRKRAIAQPAGRPCLNNVEVTRHANCETGLIQPQVADHAIA